MPTGGFTRGRWLGLSEVRVTADGRRRRGGGGIGLLRRGAASLDGQDLRLDASCLCFGAGVELGLGRVGRNLATRPRWCACPEGWDRARARVR